MIVFDDDIQLFRPDEVEALLRVLGMEAKLGEETRKMLEPNVRKALHTCQFLLVELLGASRFNDEFEPLALELAGGT